MASFPRSTDGRSTRSFTGFIPSRSSGGSFSRSWLSRSRRMASASSRSRKMEFMRTPTTCAGGGYP